MADGKPGAELIVEDLLLLLFNPESGSIAGEGTLYYPLAGAVLADLARVERIEIEDRGGPRGRLVRAVGTPPTDPLLRPAWDRAARKPCAVPTLLAGIGPRLRAPVLDRLVDRGHLRRERRARLGLFTTTTLRAGDTPRRAAVLGEVRAALVDDPPPEPRTAALAALLSASGTLPTFHPDIPWTSPVITRAKAIERGDWGATAAATAVTSATTAAITSTLVAAGVISGE
ncbi:GPP34 family phosphoprotein [Streptomyces sp. DSM 44915]|uniref:GPP34 family phosphoprotein n=1 Tax=Streptomyces chisholmiae TaxID=3075540 RepID=A0ABU2K1E8_9ACTN|nr:GPP34 family phosphoprotein [Streptomyces sp. DSM 44915]MDT0270808.1 GPP34 family phosphoprotein [Streptomyces sp. DSM 44915]